MNHIKLNDRQMNIEFMKNDIALIKRMVYTIEDTKDIQQFCFSPKYVVDMIIRIELNKMANLPF